MNDPEYTKEARTEIKDIKEMAKARGGVSGVVINAGDLTKALGFTSDKVQCVVNAMDDEKERDDEILQQPPSGSGSSLTILYKIKEFRRDKL